MGTMQHLGLRRSHELSLRPAVPQQAGWEHTGWRAGHLDQRVHELRHVRQTLMPSDWRNLCECDNHALQFSTGNP